VAASVAGDRSRARDPIVTGGPDLLGTVEAVTTYLVRVWVPDRPGALGQVASRIGAVRGDVVGIEILERGGGRAIDELVVELPEAELLELLLAEVNQVDGVDVEDVRPLQGPAHDPALTALETAARLVDAPDGATVLSVLCKDAITDFECDWAMALRMQPAEAVVTWGDTPGVAWVSAFILGSSHLAESGTGHPGPHDMAWARLTISDLGLAVGRSGRPFRWRERRQLGALARIADRLLVRQP
jgi:hypothetical protein